MINLIKRTLRNSARVGRNWPFIGRFINIGIMMVRLPQFYQAYLHLNHQHIVLEEKQRLFESQQLPNLLQTLADVNHRQVTADNARDNLTKSAPIAIRNLTRDTVELKTQIDSMGGRFSELEKSITQHSRDIEYLYHRVEFVRRELMFEMRYGANKDNDKSNSMRAKTEILAPEKLAVMRQHLVKINLGCGHVPLEDFLNIDRRALPGVDIVAEVDELPFNEGEVDEVFSAHLIEHFPQEELKRKLLPYWRGLLKTGGTFRAIVPDADGMIDAYKSGEYDFERLREVTYGGQDYDGDFHYNMLNVSSMSRMLEEAGFGDIIIADQNRENAGCKEFEIRARRVN